MSKPKVLVTRRWPTDVEKALAQQFDVTLNTADTPLSVSDFQAAFRNFDAIMPTVTDKIPAAAFETPSIRTKILANYGVGYTHIDVEAAKARGVVVTNTPDVLSSCTADIAMTLLLMVARRAGEGERELRAGNWSGWRPTHMVGTKVADKTLGIVGFGRIGQEMARRAKFGFGMNILVQSRSQVRPDILSEFGATQVENLDALLPQCDFVSLHCPGGDANRHLINSKRLAAMRPGSFLINTARGEVVDDQALALALVNGIIRGAGLDVFDGEPQIHGALLAAPNLVMLPHLGSATRETREAMGFRALENTKAYFAGEAPCDRVA